jgi:hypothetical protein
MAQDSGRKQQLSRFATKATGFNERLKAKSRPIRVRSRVIVGSGGRRGASSVFVDKVDLAASILVVRELSNLRSMQTASDQLMTAS